jgi:phospholipase/carboxylesterase
MKINILQTYISLLLLAFSFSACAQKISEVAPFIYKVREAKVKIANPPLLLLLHGYGSNEEDLFSFAEHLDNRFVIISVRAPYPHSTGNYAWYSLDFSKTPFASNNEEAEKSRQDLGKFIDLMCQKYHADAKKVFMLGFSQGAMMSLTCALTMPEKVAGAVVLSGKLRDEVLPLIANNEQVKNTKIYISHGEKDQRVPFSEAEKAKAFLLTKRITPTFDVYKEAGHEITQENFMALRAWLTKVLN